ncbi:MAG: hypothetical protein E6Z59_04385, partial [Streptococcus parasanguinis]|nr:hypothetical protein [Streptococcus parasanguinis]
FIDLNFIFISQFHNKNTPKVRFFLSNFWGAVHFSCCFFYFVSPEPVVIGQTTTNSILINNPFYPLTFGYRISSQDLLP